MLTTLPDVIDNPLGKHLYTLSSVRIVKLCNINVQEVDEFFVSNTELVINNPT